MTSPPVTQSIGEAERRLRALLDGQIGAAGLSFPQWTILVWLDRQGSLTRDELIDRQVTSAIAAEMEAAEAIDELVARGLIEVASATVSRTLAITSHGRSLFRPVIERVSELTRELTANLPDDDIAKTRRTLDEISRRARAMLLR